MRSKHRGIERTLLAIALLALVTTAMDLPETASSQGTTGSLALVVEIEGILGPTPFAGLYGLGVDTSVIETTNPGTGMIVNDPGPSRYEPFTLERPFDPAGDALTTWYGQLRNGVVDKRAASLIFLDGPGGPELGRFNAFQAWPCSYSLGPVVAGTGGVPSEFITICYDLLQNSAGTFG